MELAFGDEARRHRGINAAQRAIYVVPSHTPHDMISRCERHVIWGAPLRPTRVAWGMRPAQTDFLAYARAQCTTPVAEREVWRVRSSSRCGGPLTSWPCYKVYGVYGHGECLPRPFATAARPHYDGEGYEGILFRQCCGFAP